ncbi:23S rRNA (cytidine1920-2'-O)/16S rRNA (cytidine1409-2'-O)-methyltransferase [Symbiobacterium terraclitae]|uniref:23S rRNA (Cytidine1920-2'-O)/16S rRNA (Cytidine1409-2'-O)-methyltransferase n=1 Tax=Symbiobacterium terraclitae TaxID=557451 RepID=A0ABS4JMC1_9FIRM|nr:TlyA family RNA methyltransferase [Symbiobacterium terraclitae]MBP2016694.1 23S rRNA (cytidine1920-2'-O)/16S rRNA (cytidine1409-2'-O)-methyltransferase [Symbiobacterium terraclitae]
MAEQRLDVALVARGLAPSRERAQEAIAAGMVRVNGQVVTKASRKVGPEDGLEVSGDPIGYVGRGGLKLEGALDAFGLSPAGLVCLDVGASTGGFTDCLLRRGARLVYAVDVGRGQLHPSLRADPRVVAMEETDIREVAHLAEAPALAAVDVSFISLTLVLPHVARLLAPGGQIVALIKPQFEVGPAGVGKGGIVRDPRQHRRAVDRVLGAAAALGLVARRVIDSPITGTEGNREFLAWFAPAADLPR